VTTPTRSEDEGNNGDRYDEAKRSPGTRKPRRSNPHFMTGPEAIAELDGIMSRNEFYEQVNNNRIPHLDRRPGERVRVLRDFVSQLKERALRKLDQPRDSTKMIPIQAGRSHGDKGEGEA
jgi:hypothetical protein